MTGSDPVVESVLLSSSDETQSLTKCEVVQKCYEVVYRPDRVTSVDCSEGELVIEVKSGQL